MKEKIVNRDHLVSGRAYLQNRLQDPEFKAAYEAEQIRAEVARVFKEKRKSLKISQSELAKKSHTDQKVISRIENGATSVGVDLLQKVASALGAKISITLG